MNVVTMMELAALTTEGRAALKEDFMAMSLPEEASTFFELGFQSMRHTQAVAEFVASDGLPPEVEGRSEEELFPRTRKFLAEMIGELMYLDHSAAEAVGVRE